MKFKFLISFTFLLLITALESNAQSRKIDTTVLLNKTGYKVYCNNKRAESNDIVISPVGFENTAREMNFVIKGKLAKAVVDDFNHDGFPDLVIYVYGGVDGTYGTVYALTSNENKSCSGIIFPDLLDDSKLRIGYKGHDEFSLLEGTIMRRFPLYDTLQINPQPTASKRVVQYQLGKNENGGLKFKVIRSYETK